MPRVTEMCNSRRNQLVMAAKTAAVIVLFTPSFAFHAYAVASARNDNRPYSHYSDLVEQEVEAFNTPNLWEITLDSQFNDSPSTYQKIRQSSAVDDDDEADLLRHLRIRRSLASETPQLIVNTLNNIRRSVSATDMYYVAWDRVLAEKAGDLILSCDLKTRSSINLSSSYVKYFQGLSGYLSNSTSISDQLRVINKSGQDPQNTFYLQIMSSRLVSVGCDISTIPCKISDGSSDDSPPPPPAPPSPIKSRTTSKRPPISRMITVFACIFGYTRPPDPNRYYTSGRVNCSKCDQDAIMCDGGLCRTSCQSDGDFSCNDRCQEACSDCSTAADLSDCQCICYYGNGQSRCQDQCTASSSQPVCKDLPPSTTFSAAWLVFAVIAVILLLMILSLVSCCIYRRFRSRCRSRRNCESAPSNSSSCSTNSAISGGGSSEPISCIMSPPSYDVIIANPEDCMKPPPYCVAVQFCQDPPAYSNVTFADDNQAFPLMPSAPTLQPNSYTVDDLPQPVMTTTAEAPPMVRDETNTNAEETG